MLLMLVGSAGVVTVIATLMLSFVGAGGRETGLRVVLLLGGLVVLLALAQSAAFDRALSHLIVRALRRWTDLDVRDYASLLHLGGEYQVNELFVGRDHWAAGRPLGELRVWEEGLRVLGVLRADGTYLGAPIPSTEVRPGDTLVVYGRAPELAAFQRRPTGPAGDDAHHEAVARRQAEGARALPLEEL